MPLPKAPTRPATMLDIREAAKTKAARPKASRAASRKAIADQEPVQSSPPRSSPQALPGAGATVAPATRGSARATERPLARLLSEPDSANSDRLELQSRMEAKLRSQVEQLLAPMVGAENFSSEIQVELDMSEVTSARESYDKDGAVRRETTQTSTSATGTAMGVPGVLANTPPPDPEAVEGAPEGGQAAAAPGEAGESSATRTYELGREVAVSNMTPGGVKRLSVAVALNQDALEGAKPADIAKFEQLVSAAVGANPDRGDAVAVVVRPFEPVEAEELPFWEAPWFAMVVRNAVALISVLLILFLVARPIVRSLTAPKEENEGEEGGEGDIAALPAARRMNLQPMQGEPDREQLSAQIELAQRIVREQPDDALLALRRMLGDARGSEGVA